MSPAPRLRSRSRSPQRNASPSSSSLSENDPIFPSRLPSWRSRSLEREASDSDSDTRQVALYRDIIRRHDPIFPSGSETPSPPRRSRSPQRESSPPRAETPYDETLSHHSYCECFWEINYLEELKFTGRAWFWACKASLDKILWLSVHKFLTRAIRMRRFAVWTTDCTCPALNPPNHEGFGDLLRQGSPPRSEAPSPFSDDDPRIRGSWSDDVS